MPNSREFMQQIGAKGGSKKGVLKGWAYMKLHQPERFKELAEIGRQKGIATRRKKAKNG